MSVDGIKFFGLVVVLADLGGADEGEVEGPEKEHNILASELFERDLLELVLPPGLTLESRSRFADAKLF